MISFLRTVSQNRKLLANLVVRDLRARYVGSSMGFFWSVIFPIINLVIFTFVFKVILNARWADHQNGETVAMIMLMGIVVWAAFAESMSRCTNSLVENSNLIQKVVFPSEVLPVFIVISSLINMIISMPVLFIGMAVLIYIFPETHPEALARMKAAGDDGFQFGFALVFLPFLIGLQALFTTGLGLFFAAFNLYWRDTFHLMGVALTVWMFTTPIFYPAAAVESKGYGFLLIINPMHWLIDLYREVVLYGHWPDPLMLGLMLVVSSIVLALGAAFFRHQKHRFPDLL